MELFPSKGVKIRFQKSDFDCNGNSIFDDNITRSIKRYYRKTNDFLQHKEITHGCHEISVGLHDRYYIEKLVLNNKEITLVEGEVYKAFNELKDAFELDSNTDAYFIMKQGFKK